MNSPVWRRLASLALWIALVVEAAWLSIERLAHHASWDRLAQPVVFLALFAVLAILRGRLAWYPFVIRVFLAYEFGSAVADRLG